MAWQYRQARGAYAAFLEGLRRQHGEARVKDGVFGAMMDVSLVVGLLWWWQRGGGWRDGGWGPAMLGWQGQLLNEHAHAPGCPPLGQQAGPTRYRLAFQLGQHAQVGHAPAGSITCLQQ